MFYHTENIHCEVLLGHFVCKIDNSQASVALDPDGIRAQPTLGDGSALIPLGSTFRVNFGADRV